MGVGDAEILSQTEYQLRTAYAVSSGRYNTEEQDRAHLQELATLGIPSNGRFYREVTRGA